jgi:hypothetical protein
MGKLTHEELMSHMEYKCARCGADCVKTDPLEPILGYASKVDGSFVGPICKDCEKVVPKDDRKEQKHLTAAFVVAIRPDGEGYAIIQDGIEIPYLRDATVYEIKSACQEIVSDLISSKTLARMQGMNKQSSTTQLLKKR